MLVRITNMRGVDLRLFDFDFDLTWAAFFMNAEGHILGRYGGRNEQAAEAHLSLAGLKYAMQRALLAHRKAPKRPAKLVPLDANEAARPEEFAGARRLKEGECIHCHQVYDFRREAFEGDWRKQRVWVYPPPENLGLIMHVDQGDLVQEVMPGSPAAGAGLQPQDRLLFVVPGNAGDAIPIASYADLQYALHRTPADAPHIALAWERNGREHDGKLLLPEGWRKSDISWRASMWGITPRASVWGQDLSAEEKESLGLLPARLAFRQGDYVPPQAARAGVRAGDIVLGIDGLELEMTMLQFNAYVRLNYEVGDTVTLNLIRDGKRLDLPMKLEEHD